LKSRGEKQSQQKKLQVRASQKKEDAIARNVRKVARHGVLPMICGAAVSRSAISMSKCPKCSDHFLKFCGQIWRATVAQSAIGSQNAQNTACWDHNRLGLAWNCGAKHVWKPKCSKHTMLGPLFEVGMSKHGAPL